MGQRERTSGRAECPHCHECHAHDILSVFSDGWPDKVRCRACGETWTYYTPGQLVERRRRYDRDEHRKYYERHKEELRAHKRAYAADARRRRREAYERDPDYITCPVCGAVFVDSYDRQRGQRVYCSLRCRQRARDVRRHHARNVIHRNHRVTHWMEDQWQRITRSASSTMRSSSSLTG